MHPRVQTDNHNDFGPVVRPPATENLREMQDLHGARTAMSPAWSSVPIDARP
jgi:hypothetical protein